MPDPVDSLIAAGLSGGISNDDYHNAPGISSSQLKLVLRAPAYFQASLAGMIPRKESASMKLGTLVHALVLEPETVETDYVVGPKFGRSKTALEQKEDFLALHAGKILVEAALMQKAQAMARSLLNLEDVQHILAYSVNEQSAWYRDPETKLVCKYRPDIRTDFLIADVKTCADASLEGFGRAAANFGYALSAAHYIEGDRILTGTTHDQFVFLCVESEPPYLAATYVLELEDLDFGRWQRRQALDTIATCELTGAWPSYNHGGPTSLSLPQWTKRKYLESL